MIGYGVDIGVRLVCGLIYSALVVWLVVYTILMLKKLNKIIELLSKK